MYVSVDQKSQDKNQPANHQHLAGAHSMVPHEVGTEHTLAQQPNVWQRIANNSLRTQRIAQFQAMANGHSKAKIQRSDFMVNSGFFNRVASLQAKGPVQRMVAFNNYNRVYALDSLQPGSPEETNRMRTSINTLTKRNDQLVFSNSSNFDRVLTENIDPETQKLLRYENKYVEKDQARALTAKASKDQQNRALDPDQRKAITDQLGTDLNALTVNAAWEKKLALRDELSEERTVYEYPSANVLDNPYTYPTEHKLIAIGDMLDAPGVLGAVGNPNEICAIETISDFGGDVHDMWNDLPSNTTVGAWHTACRTKGLDYRNDNEYIKILMKLGYTLVQNQMTVYNQIDWNAAHLGNGNYFLSTGAGDIGHAIGVTVAGGVVTAIHDRQGIHADDEQVKYIFKE